jgi:hypothetical protein
LHKMHMTWSTPTPLVKKAQDAYPLASAPLERLPTEVLGMYWTTFRDYAASC